MSRIDYETTNSIMDKLEKEGVVGPCRENLTREVLIHKDKEILRGLIWKLK